MKKKHIHIHAFTLIELLTVIAIIGILTAIIIPTIGKVRNVAKQTVCASNIRQIGMSLLMFADDNHGYGPRGYGLSKIAVGSEYYNFGELLPYLDFTRPTNALELKILPPVFRCPGANPGKISSLLSYPSVGDCTYYMNNDTGTDPQGNTPCGISMDGKKVGEGARLANLPPRRVAIIDYTQWWVPDGGTSMPNHSGSGANVFRLNGSVSWIKNARSVSAANGTGWKFYLLDDAK